MQKLLLAGALALLACGDATTYDYDMGYDLALPIEAIHVGASASTCCLTPLGTTYVLYLANPVPSGPDSRGRPQPATGELHLATPYGGDWKLGSNVPVFAYGFTPDGRRAMYTSLQRSGNYALHFVTLTFPDLPAPVDKVVIADGLTNDPLDQQAFFSASGRFYIIGALNKNVAKISDLHVVDVEAGTDIFKLGAGSFAYLEVLNNDDTMIYGDAVNSTKAGTPSKQGMYRVALGSLVKGATPVKLDGEVATFKLMSDGNTVLYTRSGAGELKLYDTRRGYTATIAPKSVVAFDSGPLDRGPIVYVTGDHSLHVTQKFGDELLATPPGSVDPFSSVAFSPDVTRVYWWNRVSSQDSFGDLYTLQLPPAGDGQPRLLERGTSTGDLQFLQHQMLYIRKVDGRGETGELVVADEDGGNALVLSRSAVLGGLRTAFPDVGQAPAPKVRPPGPIDLSQRVVPPVFATLSGTHRDPSNMPVNSALPLIGQLVLLPGLRSAALPVAPEVHAGAFRFSDDGFELVYVDGAKWNDKALNYVGKLTFSGTIADRPGFRPDIDGVTEIGPIRNRAFYVSAPANKTPGVYFIKY